jgi:hypothetical protein
MNTRLFIKDILPNMRNIGLFARVLSFNNDLTVISDETGQCKLKIDKRFLFNIFPGNLIYLANLEASEDYNGDLILISAEKNVINRMKSFNSLI